MSRVVKTDKPCSHGFAYCCQPCTRDLHEPGSPVEHHKCVIQPLMRSDGSFKFDDKNITSIVEDAHIKRSNTTNSAVFDDKFYDDVNERITFLIESEMHLLSGDLLTNSEP